MLLLKYLVVQSLTWALDCDRPQRRRSVLLQVLEVDRDEGRGLTRCTHRSKFDEASFNVLVNRQDHQAPTVGPCKTCSHPQREFLEFFVVFCVVVCWCNHCSLFI